MMNIQHLKHTKKQSGFVLVLALVMLAVMTLIGVSSMESANLELRATASSQQHQIAFNAVQSLLEFAISKDGEAQVNYQTQDSTPQVLTHTLANTSGLTATVEYAGCSVGLGTSLEEGKGFNYNFFEITGTGSNSTGTARSIQGQGIRYPSASC